MQCELLHLKKFGWQATYQSRKHSSIFKNPSSEVIHAAINTLPLHKFLVRRNRHRSPKSHHNTTISVYKFLIFRIGIAFLYRTGLAKLSLQNYKINISTRVKYTSSTGLDEAVGLLSDIPRKLHEYPTLQRNKSQTFEPDSRQKENHSSVSEREILRIRKLRNSFKKIQKNSQKFVQPYKANIHQTYDIRVHRFHHYNLIFRHICTFLVYTVVNRHTWIELRNTLSVGSLLRLDCQSNHYRHRRPTFAVYSVRISGM